MPKEFQIGTGAERRDGLALRAGRAEAGTAQVRVLGEQGALALEAVGERVEHGGRGGGRREGRTSGQGGSGSCGEQGAAHGGGVLPRGDRRHRRWWGRREVRAVFAVAGRVPAASGDQLLRSD